MRGAVYGDLFISVHHGKSGELHVPKGMCAQRDAARAHTHVIGDITWRLMLELCKLSPELAHCLTHSRCSVTICLIEFLLMLIPLLFLSASRQL